MTENCWRHRGKIPYMTTREAQVARKKVSHYGIRRGGAQLKIYYCDACHRYFLATDTKRAERMRQYREQREAKRAI